MSAKTVVTLEGGGIIGKKMPIDQIVIPDLWHVAQRQKTDYDKNLILNCWHICHDLKNFILELE